MKGEDEAINYSIVEIDPSSFRSSSTVVMLNLWRGPSHYSGCAAPRDYFCKEKT